MTVPGNISVAKNLITESISITRKYYSNSMHTLSEAHLSNKLNSFNVNFSQAEYEEFIGAFKAEVEKGSERNELLLDVEMKHMDSFGEFVSFIEMNKDYWVAKNGAFIFQRQEDLDEFNKLVGEIRLIERMQSQIMLDLRGDFVE